MAGPIISKGGIAMDDAERGLREYGTIVYRVCFVKLAGFAPTLADDAYQNTFL